MTPKHAIRLIGKPLVFALCLSPLAWFAWAAWVGGLGANPVEAANRFTGDWALRFIVIALMVSPLCQLSGWGAPMRFRRMLGLFAFAYSFLHTANYIALDQFFDWQEIWADVYTRRYITVGWVAFLLLFPLAATSTNAMVRRLGAERWKKLHRLVYLIAIGSVIHYFLMVKADVREPLIYAAVLALLLGYRVVAAMRRRTGRARRRAPRVQPV